MQLEIVDLLIVKCNMRNERFMIASFKLYLNIKQCTKTSHSIYFVLLWNCRSYQNSRSTAVISKHISSLFPLSLICSLPLPHFMSWTSCKHRICMYCRTCGYQFNLTSGVLSHQMTIKQNYVKKCFHQWKYQHLCTWVVI